MLISDGMLDGRGLVCCKEGGRQKSKVFKWRKVTASGVREGGRDPAGSGRVLHFSFDASRSVSEAL